MYAGIVKNAKTAWVTLLIGVAVIIGLFALPAEENDATGVGGLDDKYQSTQVAELLEEFPDAQESSAIVVVSREDGGPLTDADTAAIADINAAATEAGRRTDTGESTPGKSTASRSGTTIIASWGRRLSALAAWSSAAALPPAPGSSSPERTCIFGQGIIAFPFVFSM